MREVRPFAGADALAEEAAREVTALAARAVRARGLFSIALAGGSTPRALYARLAEPPYTARIDWSRVEVFWGDERCVPPDHEDSNFRMAHEALLSRVPVPPARVHRMQGENPDPDAAAADYEDELRRVLRVSTGGHARLDVVLLGLGADGHTASLFPGTPALAASERLVIASYVPQLDATRITLTFEAINAAANILFLVTGREKAQTVQNVLHGAYRPDELPAQRTREAQGRVFWFLDGEASGQPAGGRDQQK